MTKQYLEDFEIGEQTESAVGRTISEYDMYVCGGLEGSYSELHYNKEYMKNTEWGEPIVQGVLTMVIMMGLAKRLPWNPNALGLYGFDNVRFINPVFIDDTLYLTAEVLDKELRDDGRGLLTLKEDLYNQNDELVVTRERKFLIETKN